MQCAHATTHTISFGAMAATKPAKYNLPCVSSVDMFYVFMYARQFLVRGPTATLSVDDCTFRLQNCSAFGLALLMQGLAALLDSGLITEGELRVVHNEGSVYIGPGGAAASSLYGHVFTSSTTLHALYHAKLTAGYPVNWTVAGDVILTNADVRWILLQPLLAHYLRQCVGGSVAVALDEYEDVDTYPFLSLVHVVEAAPRMGCVWQYKKSKLRRFLLYGTAVKKEQLYATVVATYADLFRLFSTGHQTVVFYQMHTHLLLVKDTMFLVERTYGLNADTLALAARLLAVAAAFVTTDGIVRLVIGQTEIGTEVLVCGDLTCATAEADLFDSVYVTECEGAQAQAALCLLFAGTKVTACGFVTSTAMSADVLAGLFDLAVFFLKSAVSAPILKHNGVHLSMDLSESVSVAAVDLAALTKVKK